MSFVSISNDISWYSLNDESRVHIVCLSLRANDYYRLCSTLANEWQTCTSLCWWIFASFRQIFMVAINAILWYCILFAHVERTVTLSHDVPDASRQDVMWNAWIRLPSFNQLTGEKFNLMNFATTEKNTLSRLNKAGIMWFFFCCHEDACACALCNEKLRTMEISKRKFLSFNPHIGSEVCARQAHTWAHFIIKIHNFW